jgi:hypothetical protein
MSNKKMATNKITATNKKNGGHTGSSPFFLFSASANGLGPKF